MAGRRLTAEEEKARVRGMYEIERQKYAEGFSLVCGTDEAGRGPLAGAVFAAAVILPKELFICGINDSKKLSQKKREELYDVITEKAIAYGISCVDEKRIDEINILNAAFEAMNSAVAKLGVKPDFVLVDGNQIRGMELPHMTVVKGDALSASIAAASILAKVSRDRYITEMASKYPQYGFERHKGYGTAEHIAALLKYGPCPIHRASFLKKILSKTT